MKVLPFPGVLCAVRDPCMASAMERLMGMVIVAISVQMLMDGVASLLARGAAG